MSPSPLQLSLFLSSSKADFLQLVHDRQSLSNWVVCTGNEAGDTDSIASAIGFAYFASLSATPPTPKRYIPIILTASADYYLRPENVEIFNFIHVPIEAALSISDLPSSDPSILTTLGAKYALVDHNSLLPLYIPTPAPANLDSLVVAVIDHHVDEGQSLSASPRLISPVGSCSSLVVDYFHTFPQFPSNNLSAEVSTLLLSAVLIDTSLKLVANGGKATTVDIASAQILIDFASAIILPVVGSEVEGGENPIIAFTNRLKELKENVAHLSGRDLIRRDYKAYTVSSWSYGIGTVPLSLQEAWLDRKNGWDKLESSMDAWVEEQSLSLLVVATTFGFKKKSKDGNGEKKKKEKIRAREFVLYLRKSDRERLHDVFIALEQDETLNLKKWEPENVGADLDHVAPLGGKKWKIWQQGNESATRKQIAPVLKKILETLAKQGA